MIGDVVSEEEFEQEVMDDTLLRCGEKHSMSTGTCVGY